MTDPGPVPRWTLDDERAYGSARARIGAVIAAYSARIGAADEAGDDATAEELSDVQFRFEEIGRGLSIGDKDLIARINAEFPAVLARVRAGVA